MSRMEYAGEQGRPFPVLHSERLLLREFRPADAEAVFAIFCQDAVTRYHNQETMQSIGQAEKLVQARAELFRKGWGIRWAIVRMQHADTVIGSCGYYRLDGENRSAEIGYDLHPACWRQGIMTEALGAVIDYGYGEAFGYRLNRIEALTYVEHEASARLLRRLGFQEEGVRREYGFWKGAFHDVRVFSLLRRDWET